MTLQDEIMALVRAAPKPPEEPDPPQGATDAQLDELAARIQLDLPPDLRAWLALCNAPPIGPGGMFGARSQADGEDIGHLLAVYPTWRANGWIPVAGDGVGNYYILDTTRRTRLGHPILFIDHEDDCDKIAYVVASDLWHFLRHLLEEDIEGDRRLRLGLPQMRDSLFVEREALPA